MLIAAGIGLLLAACGVGTDRDMDPSERIDVRTLQLKLRALMTDPCHREPAEQLPRHCEKFVTQLANTANTVAAAGRAGYPELAGPARRMTEQIDGYRKGDCHTARPDDAQACVAALSALADALGEVEAQLTQS